MHSNEFCWIAAGACSWRSCCFQSLTSHLSPRSCAVKWEVCEVEVLTSLPTRKGIWADWRWGNDTVRVTPAHLPRNSTPPPRDAGFASQWDMPARMKCNTKSFKVKSVLLWCERSPHYVVAGARKLCFEWVTGPLRCCPPALWEAGILDVPGKCACCLLSSAHGRRSMNRNSLVNTHLVSWSCIFLRPHCSCTTWNISVLHQLCFLFNSRISLSRICD